MIRLWLRLADGRIVGGTYSPADLLARLAWLRSRPEAVADWWIE